MKPFDLKQAKSGLPLVTRNGNNARFIAHVPDFAPDWRVLAYVEGKTSVMSYSDNGKAFDNSSSGDDLFMATAKRSAWVNIYMDGCVSAIHESKEQADKNSHSGRVACCRVEWEE